MADGGETVIGREAIKFSLMLSLSDRRFTEFMALPYEQQFAIAAAIDISPRELVTGIEQFHAIIRVGIGELFARMQPPGDGKPS
jgi:hypothetical protein